MKCDETRPSCVRCTSTRRVCDGYDHQSPHSPHSDVGSVTIALGPSFDIDASPQAKRSFSFFVQRTCRQLAGFFGSYFWETLVLQAAHHESAVQHAAVAIGALHELVEQQSAMTNANRTFALEQYNLAIKSLLVPLCQNGERGVDVCLMACILFACFEVYPPHSIHWLPWSYFYPPVLWLYADCFRICKGVMTW